MGNMFPEGAPTPEAAAAALAAAVSADQGREAPGVPGPGAAPGTAEVTPPANQPDPPAATPSEDDAGATPVADEAPESLIRSADIDLSGLTPDAKAWLEAREREMQGVMTQRTQEAAEIRKQFEDLGDPTEAREALAFYQGIRTDPNYAAQVYDFLTTNLMAAGYSPAQAAAAALTQMDDPVEEIPETPALPEGGDDVDEALARRLTEIDRRTQQLDARFTEAEQREQHARMVNEILRQDNAIRQAHPDYTDEHVDMIYALAESTEGNLFAAEQMFSKFREAEIQRYISSKETADDPAPPATPPAAILETPRTLDQAHTAALERLRTELAQGN